MGLFSNNGPATQPSTPPPKPGSTAAPAAAASGGTPAAAPNTTKPSAPVAAGGMSKPPPPPGHGHGAGGKPGPSGKGDKGMDEKTRRFYELKGAIHRKLVEQLDMSKLNRDASDDLKHQVREVVLALCEEENTLLNQSEKQRLADEVLDEAFGLGPLETLLKDSKISDILINGPNQVFIEKGGRLTQVDVKFKDNGHLLHIIDKICSPLGRRCDEVCPMVDARLKDGSRVNAVIPPLAIDGPSLSIRRFGKDTLKWDDYVRFKSCSQEMVEFLQACVHAGLNIIVSGGTGSGKTTLLNNLSSFIPEDDRIVTIEDAAELQLRQPHVVRLETRPANLEGKGRITIRDLLINSLRMRPDRIVVGECRGGETLDMLQAMNTGHDGSMTTIHANNTRDAVQRVETMVMMAGYELPIRAIRQQFASAVGLIVQAARLPGGRRKIIAVTEVQGMEGDMVVMQDIFKFDQQGTDSEGRAYGEIVSTGVRPLFMERLIAHGCHVDPKIFHPRALCSDMD